MNGVIFHIKVRHVSRLSTTAQGEQNTTQCALVLTDQGQYGTLSRREVPQTQ